MIHEFLLLRPLLHRLPAIQYQHQPVPSQIKMLLELMVDHVILLEKLEAYGVDNCSLEWFKSYLTNRRQLVSLSGKESGMVNIKHGVPQGSILGPLLFIVFINDLPLHVTSSQIDLHADDTTLIASVDYESTHSSYKSRQTDQYKRL